MPRLPGRGAVPRVHDTASGALVPSAGRAASLYVCGITPYDATHLGHANTYLAFDTLVRAWLDAGVEVEYAQNTTDVDDPLLARAAATGVEWRELAAEQTELYRRDMAALGVVPPDAFIAVTEVIEPVGAAVARLLATGLAYRLDDDVYFDTAAAETATPWRPGDQSHLDREAMLALSAERGGDPQRPGKRDPLDALLWRGRRDGEPWWESPVGPGRPGWHIECSVIAQESVALPLSVKGGAHDLVFPHHDFSSGHTAALTGAPLADAYVHAGLVGLDGEKMSKSRGNLVFVRRLIDDGVDPRAIRLALLAHRYRDDWEWTDADLVAAQRRLARWDAAEPADDPGDALLEPLRAAIAADLDTPAALALVDRAVGAGLGRVDRDAIDALLGIRLPPSG